MAADILWDEIETVTQADDLTLYDAGIKDFQSISSLSDIPLLQLTTLNLHSNRITSFTGADLLGNLRHLDLSSNLLTNLQGIDVLFCGNKKIRVRGFGGEERANLAVWFMFFK